MQHCCHANLNTIAVGYTCHGSENSSSGSKLLGGIIGRCSQAAWTNILFNRCFTVDADSHSPFVCYALNLKFPHIAAALDAVKAPEGGV